MSHPIDADPDNHGLYFGRASYLTSQSRRLAGFLDVDALASGCSVRSGPFLAAGGSGNGPLGSMWALLISMPSMSDNLVFFNEYTPPPPQSSLAAQLEQVHALNPRLAVPGIRRVRQFSLSTEEAVPYREALMDPTTQLRSSKDQVYDGGPTRLEARLVDGTRRSGYCNVSDAVSSPTHELARAIWRLLAISPRGAAH